MKGKFKFQAILQKFIDELADVSKWAAVTGEKRNLKYIITQVVKDGKITADIFVWFKRLYDEKI